jgi:hypothetical protein
MATTEEHLAELIEIAQEHLRWQRAAVLPDVRKTIEQALGTSQLRKAYEQCDGKKSSTDIAKAVGISKQAFSAWTTSLARSRHRLRDAEADHPPSGFAQVARSGHRAGR